MNPVDFAAGLSAGLAVAAALYLILWWISRRSRARQTGLAESRTPPTEIAAVGVDPKDAGSSVDVLPPLAIVRAEIRAPVAVAAEPDAPAPPPPRKGSTSNGTLRLSQRVILHVYAQGRWPPGEVAPVGLCQAGMVEALGIPQAGLAAVLRRLEAAGILEGERAHVRGRDRRLKVYRLSPRGLDLAQELRRRPRGKPER